MELKIESCTIDIDETATREYYSAHPEHNGCSCSGCENYRRYAPQLPVEIRAFFKSCGIDDMRVISEIIPFAMTDGGLLLYGGFYHLVGSMSGGKSITLEITCYKNDNGKTVKLSDVRTHTESDTIAIGRNFTVYFILIPIIRVDKIQPQKLGFMGFVAGFCHSLKEGLVLVTASRCCPRAFQKRLSKWK